MLVILISGVQYSDLTSFALIQRLSERIYFQAYSGCHQNLVLWSYRTKVPVFLLAVSQDCSVSYRPLT